MHMKHIKHTAKFIVVALLFLFVMTAVVFAHDNSMSPADTTPETENVYAEDTAKRMEHIDLIKDILIPLILQTLGVFGGFMSALAISNRENCAQSKELDFSLKEELLSIKDELEKRVNSPQKYLMFQYLTPAWDSSLASGIMSAPSNRTVYQKYYKIYSQIKYAQKLEKEYTQSNVAKSLCAVVKNIHEDDFLEKYIKLTDTEREKSAASIYEDIQNLLEKRS